MNRPARTVILGVLGLTGGSGASCLAAALALRASRAGCRTLLVDGHPSAGGIDLLVGDDLTPGLGWAELSGARGVLDVAALAPRLAHLGPCSVLSWGRRPPMGRVAPGDVAVWGALAETVDLVVADLPHLESVACQPWLERCTHALVTHRADVPGVAAAMVGVDGLVVRADEPRLIGAVVRSGVVTGVQAVIDAVGLPLLGVLGEDPSVEEALTRGDPVGGRDGALARTADRVLAGHVVGAVEGAA